MSVVLQVSAGGGPFSTGRVSAAVGESIQLTAASFAGWRTPVARWTIYDFPPGFAQPAGWSTDATSGFYYWDGNTDPPAFTITVWGKYQLKLSATDGDDRVTDSSTGIVVLSTIGLAGGIVADEDGAFGGNRERWVYDIKRDLRVLDALLDGTSTGSFSSLLLDQGGDTLAIDVVGAEWSVVSTGNLELSGDDLQLNVGTGGTLTITENANTVITLTPDADAATSLTIAPGTTLTVSQAQSTSGAGRTMVFPRAQRGQAGFAGADLYIGGGDGGTPGTNVAGNTHIVLGTPVTNQTAQFYLERENGTKILTIYEIASGTCGIYGGAVGGTADLHIQGTQLTYQSSGLIRFRQATGSWIKMGESSTDCEWIGYRRSTSPITTATTTTVGTFPTASNRVYEVEMRLTVTNDTDNQGATYRRFASFKNVAGAVTQIGATDNGGTTDKEDAGQTGLSAGIVSSGTDIRFQLTTDAADTVNYTIKMSVLETVLA